MTEALSARDSGVSAGRALLRRLFPRLTAGRPQALAACAGVPSRPPVAPAADGATPGTFGCDPARILHTVGLPLYVTDLHGRLTFYNEAAADFWGLRPPLHDTLWSCALRLYLADGTPLPHAACPAAIALKEGRAIRGAKAIAERPDGTRIPFISCATPLRDADGSVVGAVSVLVDVSDCHAAERRAQEAAGAKARFLAAMSHEFRTPIHSILGFTELLAEAAREGHRLEPEHAEWLAEMRGAGRHLLELITDAIAFAETTIAPARPIAARRHVGLGSIVADALSLAATAFAARGLAVVPEGRGRDPVAALDPPAARQALLGVLREAARHMPEGGTLHLAWGASAAEGMAWIALRCPGLALPPDLLAELDRPFANTDRDIYARGLEGSGLSVATAAALLRCQGGELTITGGRDGTPATFRLAFPLASEADAGPSRPRNIAAMVERPAQPAARLSPPPRPTFSLADVVAAARDVIIVTTADLDQPGPTVVYVNPAFTELTGYSAEEVVGRTPRILQGPGTDRALLRHLSDELRAGRDARGTVLNYARDGTRYYLDMHIVPLRNAQGHVTHFAAIERVVDMQPAAVAVT